MMPVVYSNRPTSFYYNKIGKLCCLPKLRKICWRKYKRIYKNVVINTERLYSSKYIQNPITKSMHPAMLSTKITADPKVVPK